MIYYRGDNLVQLPGLDWKKIFDLNKQISVRILYVQGVRNFQKSNNGFDFLAIKFIFFIEFSLLSFDRFDIRVRTFYVEVFFKYSWTENFVEVSEIDLTWLDLKQLQFCYPEFYAISKNSINFP